MITFSIIFLIIGITWFIYWLVWGRFNIYTEDAYVNGNIVEIMSQVPGTVIEINTDDTYLVKKGQPLIKLDPADMDIALQRSKASLAQTVRQVRQSFDYAEQVQSLLLLRYADLKKAQFDLKRRLGLIKGHAISREELQHYQTAADNANAQYRYTFHQLNAARALVNHVHLYAHPEVERVKAAVRTAYLNLQRTTILAPVTGYVTKRTTQIGQHVSINTPMLAIVPLNQVWVEANYKESQLSNLRIGQPVTLYADAYPNVTYHGTIVGLSAGTGAAFSLLPPQNATGNWIKIVQRLPVRVRLDPDDLKKYPLQIGLSMRVTTNVYDTSGRALAIKPEQQAFYSTDIYTGQLINADKLINAILRDNAPDNILSTPSDIDHKLFY
jgi:membrane fusion protein (multidrug efflux system)